MSSGGMYTGTSALNLQPHPPTTIYSGLSLRNQTSRIQFRQYLAQLSCIFRALPFSVAAWTSVPAPTTHHTPCTHRPPPTQHPPPTTHSAAITQHAPCTHHPPLTLHPPPTTYSASGLSLRKADLPESVSLVLGKALLHLLSSAILSRRMLGHIHRRCLAYDCETVLHDQCSSSKQLFCFGPPKAAVYKFVTLS